MIKIRTILLWSVFALSFGAKANLIDRGNGLIYDQDQDITFLANANLFAMQYANDNSIVADIIASEGHVPSVYWDGFAYATRPLSELDFDGDSGRMSFFGARAWASWLTYAGHSDWRLPFSDYVCGENYCSGSELTYLFDEHLQIPQVILAKFSDSPVPEAGWFSDVQGIYWTQGADADDYWSSFVDGFQDKEGVGLEFNFVWAVADGDIASQIPEPSSVWLSFGALLLLVRRPQPSRLLK